MTSKGIHELLRYTQANSDLDSFGYSVKAIARSLTRLLASLTSALQDLSWSESVS